jgi:riboflavin transporter
MSSTKKITTIAMLTAMAMVLNLLIQFPIVPAVSFLSYDPKDIIIVIGGFIYGPFTSFIMSALCSFLEIAFRGGNLLDVLMNMISTCTFACVAAAIYKYNHTKNGAIIGLVSGIICCTLSMTLWNYVVTPYYYNMPRSAVVAMLLPGIIPFNLIKAGLNSAFAMLIYKPVVSALRSAHFVQDSQSKEGLTKDVAIVCAFILVTLIAVVFVMKG